MDRRRFGLYVFHSVYVYLCFALITRLLQSSELLECFDPPGHYSGLCSLSMEDWVHENIQRPNHFVENHDNWPAHFPVNCWIKGYLEENHASTRFLGRCVSPTENRATNILSWSRPQEGWIKVNTDVAVNIVDDHAAIGCLFRSNQGDRIFASSRSLGKCSVLNAELWAICDALRHAWRLGYKLIELESDNL
ncbi:hypothetical protein F3Y22_tig00111129pilonHSYRG00074 [Hibiscus syriacus]|uniref:RNase H type-1 domain-containing protein n=1 Tax=Hibiscus syriacus TaxID=106335 RepID=A0A6A2YYE8_HIBSY|nr:hypothetical protein F3Y22_tig00111129pilonHSYRG00074 [Hibiscus syriacus]